MKPRECVGSAGTLKPVTTYPMVPPIATGKPIAAEVPIALRSGILHQTRNGTTMDPPPMETRLLKQPVSMPASVMPVAPGNWREACGPVSYTHLRAHETRHD